MSAHTDHTQTTITEESAAEQVRRKANAQLVEGEGVRGSMRFLMMVPPETEISELPELWEVYQEAVSTDRSRGEP